VSVRGTYEGIASHALNAHWNNFDPSEKLQSSAVLQAVDSITVPVLP
jgi:hypothetical protein